MPVYDRSNPEDEARLQAEIIRPPTTAVGRRLRHALSLPDKDARQAYVRRIRAKYGDQAAEDLKTAMREYAEQREAS